MGGNALMVQTRRIQDADEYQHLAKQVLTRLNRAGVIAQLIPSYFTKESHGDMDIMVTKTVAPDLVKICRQAGCDGFDSKDIQVNGEVVSFEFSDFQIDLINIPPHQYNFSFNYYSWNDLGNFIGRVAASMGFKFSNSGLWYNLNDPEVETKRIQTVLVTDDYVSALEFLGYSYDHYLRGFFTAADIFQYAATSEYFNAKNFLYDSQNSAARARSRKRKMQVAMSDWLHSNYPELSADQSSTPLDRVHHLNRAFDRFPEFRQRYDQAALAHRQAVEFGRRFNGEVISQLFGGIQGQELGAKMAELRGKIDWYGLRPFIADMLDEHATGALFRDVLTTDFKLTK